MGWLDGKPVLHTAVGYRSTQACMAGRAVRDWRLQQGKFSQPILVRNGTKDVVQAVVYLKPDRMTNRVLAAEHIGGLIHA